MIGVTAWQKALFCKYVDSEKKRNLITFYWLVFRAGISLRLPVGDLKKIVSLLFFFQSKCNFM